MRAEVGDEQHGDDPTVHALCDRMAALMGKEAAVFMPSGTMCNVAATLTHCRPGDEIIAHETCHIVTSEGGAHAALGGFQILTLPGARGMYSPDALRGAIFEMSPPGVAELGFAGALERYASEHAAAAGVELAFDVPALTLPVAMPVLESLYVVARAGIDNVVRHARARHMRVQVKCDAEELSLRIEDDGIGITDADLMKDDACSLFASSERLADSGGELRVSGRPDQGTVLEATIALRQRIRPLRQNVTKLRVA